MARPPFDIMAAVNERLPGEDLAASLIGVTLLSGLLEWDMRRTGRPGGLERSEHWALMTLWLAGPDHPLSPTELSKIVQQTTSGMTKTLRRLEAAALVERVPDPDDARRQRIRLTPIGVGLSKRGLDEMLDRWKAMLAEFGCREQTVLAKATCSALEVAYDALFPAQPKAKAG